MRSEVINLVGWTNMDVEFLARTKNNRYALPMYDIDSEGLIKSRFHDSGTKIFYSFYNGVEKEVKSFDTIGEDKKYRAFAINVDIPVDKGKSESKWIPLEAWGDVALDIHQNYRAGDLVHVRARVTRIKNINKYTIEEINLIYRSNNDDSSTGSSGKPMIGRTFM